jgi:mannopine transport system permease protein
MLPTLLIIPMSFGSERYLEFPPSTWSLHWYEELATSRSWTEPAKFSVRIAAIVAPLSTVLGVSAALAVVRGRVGHNALVRAVLAAPLIVPTIVYAIAVLLFFGRLGITGSTLGFVIAHTAVAVPFSFLVVSASLYRLNPDLELAAMNLGASRLTAIRTVTLPLLLPALLTSFVFSFLSSFDDAVISFFISGVRDKSLPRRIFEELEYSVTPAVAAVSTLLTAVSVVLLLTLLVVQARIEHRRRPIDSEDSLGP